MTPSCSNCSSAATVGTELASVCTECATATVAGASISLPAVFAAAACVAIAAFAWKMLRGRKVRTARLSVA